MIKRYGYGRYRASRLSPKSKWLTTMLTVIFGGLLFLIIMALWFRGV